MVPHPFLPDASQHISESLRGWCETPIALRREGEGHFQYDPKAGGKVWQPNRTLEQFLPCRKCLGCRRWKKAMWSGRAAIEFLQSHRTWFGTLTLNPDERYRARTLARVRLAREGRNFDDLSMPEQFRELLVELWPQVRNFIKRLRFGRKRVGLLPMDIRYLVVSEPHKDGFPHFHILLHEQEPHPGVGRRQLEAEWRDVASDNKLGLCKFKLVQDVGAARYCAKYLGKYETDRIKASQHYGTREGAPVLIARSLSGLAEPAASMADDEDAGRDPSPPRLVDRLYPEG